LIDYKVTHEKVEVEYDIFDMVRKFILDNLYLTLITPDVCITDHAILEDIR